MIIGQSAKPVVYRHEFAGTRIRLRKPNSGSARAYRVVDSLPNFPRRKLGNVFVWRQALHVDFNLRAAADTHVVNKRTCGSIAHTLQVFNDLRYALTPECTGALDKRSFAVRLLA